MWVKDMNRKCVSTHHNVLDSMEQDFSEGWLHRFWKKFGLRLHLLRKKLLPHFPVALKKKIRVWYYLQIQASPGGLGISPGR